MRRAAGWILALLVLLTACGGERPFISEDVQRLLDADLFDGEMAPVDPAVVPALYGLDRALIRDCACCMAANTAVSADQAAVLVLADAASAQAAEAACAKHVASLLEDARRYAPASAARLEAAVIRRRGNTVLLAVGDPARLAQTMDAL